MQTPWKAWLTLAIILAIGPAVLSADDLPSEVAEHFEIAGPLDDNEDFVGRFTVTTEVDRLVTSGTVKVLLFKRRFEIDIRLSEVEFADENDRPAQQVGRDRTVEFVD